LNTYQAVLFITIVALVTGRTMIFKSVAQRVPPNLTAWVIGSGTFVFTTAFFPLAQSAGLTQYADLFSWQGAVAGLMKGVLLTVLLVAQQRLITRSLSATTYVFPVAIGLIGALDVLAFNGAVKPGAMLSIAILAAAGIAFALFGHLQTLDVAGKAMFGTMVAAVVAFAVCDRIGIPVAGWYSYLVYTGLGNMISAWFLCKGMPRIRWLPWMIIALCWSIPELVFNFAIAGSLPISYGYMAISLRVPLLMIIATVFYREGRPTNQIVFGLISLVGIVPSFI